MEAPDFCVGMNEGHISVCSQWSRFIGWIFNFKCTTRWAFGEVIGSLEESTLDSDWHS